ncbi:MAG: hypothetical protein HY680_08080 [Chloroflexi bacterium]|nr:hypothetical protein [Chloroflexota bacterium]
MKKAVVDCTPIKMWIATVTEVNVTQPGEVAENIAKEMNDTAWEVLAPGNLRNLSTQDKAVMLDILKVNAELGHLLDKTPEDNRAALLALLLGAHWTLQRLDVIHTALLLMSEGDFKPQNPDIAHWLCHAARRAVKEWHSAVFAHSPLLEARLGQPRHAISDEEMGKRLGLSA